MNSQYEGRGSLNGSAAYSFRAFLAKPYSLLLALKMSLIFLSLVSLIRSCVSSFYWWVVYMVSFRWGKQDFGAIFLCVQRDGKVCTKTTHFSHNLSKETLPQRTLQIFSDTVHWSWLATEWHLWARSIDCRGFWGGILTVAIVTLWRESRRS